MNTKRDISISLRDLKVRFITPGRTIHAVNGVDLEVGRGEVPEAQLLVDGSDNATAGVVGGYMAGVAGVAWQHILARESPPAPDAPITFVTQSASSVLGLEPADLLGRRYSELVHADDAHQIAHLLAVNRPAEQMLQLRMPHSDGRTLYVSIFNDQRTIHSIDVLDTASNSVVATIPQTARPYLPAVTPDGKRLYVPNHDVAQVSVIDTATNAVIAQIRVAPNPHWVDFSPDGSFFVVATTAPVY